MTTVQDIEEAVSRLGETEIAEFRSWFEEFDAGEWDRQFERDVKRGALDALADEALKEFASGRCRDL